MSKKGRIRTQIYKLPESSTTDVSTRTKDLIDSGKALFINVLGECDEEIVRPVSIEQLNQVRTNNQEGNRQGIDYELLSKPERSALNYLSNEITRKGAHHRIKDAIQGIQLHSTGNITQSHRLFYASTKPNDESVGEIDLYQITNV